MLRIVHILSHRQWIQPLLRLNIHSNGYRVLWSANDKDLPVPSLPTPLSKAYSNDTDILLDQLRKAKTLEQILKVTEKHLNVMNNTHMVACIDNLHNYIKSERSAQELLKNDKTFQSLCARLMQGVRYLDPQDLLSTFKLLVNIGVRPNTYIMQSVLKMIGAHLNDMNLGQLVFLNFLLFKQKHNPLVDGLKLALPLVLQAQIDQQLDSDYVSDVVNCLQLASRSRLKPATIEKILAALQNKCTMLSVENAVTVIFALLNLETPVTGYQELLTYSFSIVSKNIELVHENKLLTLCRLCRNQNYYDSVFLFKLAERIVSEKWNLQHTYEILHSFYKLSFCPSDLMDHFVDVLCANSEILRTNPKYSLLSCIEYITATGYKPRNVHEAAQVLCSCIEKVEQIREMSPLLLIKFISCLSMLGHFPENLYNMLDEDYIFSALSLSKKLGRFGEFERSVFSILWGLEVYDKSDIFKFPITLLKKLIFAASQRYMNTESPLTKFFENGLGGSEFLKSHVLTQDGHVIDHVLAMRSGNYPVALQCSNFSSSSLSFAENMVLVEDIILPEDSIIVSIIVAYEEHYCRDPEVLRGWMDLKIRSLAKKKYSPVVINYKVWVNLPDREKIPYLMREIKEAVKDENVKRTTFLN